MKKLLFFIFISSIITSVSFGENKGEVLIKDFAGVAKKEELHRLITEYEQASRDVGIQFAFFSHFRLSCDTLIERNRKRIEQKATLWIYIRPKKCDEELEEAEIKVEWLPGSDPEDIPECFRDAKKMQDFADSVLRPQIVKIYNSAENNPSLSTASLTARLVRDIHASCGTGENVIEQMIAVEVERALTSETSTDEKALIFMLQDVLPKFPENLRDSILKFSNDNQLFCLAPAGQPVRIKLSYPIAFTGLTRVTTKDGESHTRASIIRPGCIHRYTDEKERHRFHRGTDGKINWIVNPANNPKTESQKDVAVPTPDKMPEYVLLGTPYGDCMIEFQLAKYDATQYKPYNKLVKDINIDKNALKSRVDVCDIPPLTPLDAPCWGELVSENIDIQNSIFKQILLEYPCRVVGSIDKGNQLIFPMSDAKLAEALENDGYVKKEILIANTELNYEDEVDNAVDKFVELAKEGLGSDTYLVGKGFNFKNQIQYKAWIDKLKVYKEVTNKKIIVVREPVNFFMDYGQRQRFAEKVAQKLQVEDVVVVTIPVFTSLKFYIPNSGNIIHHDKNADKSFFNMEGFGWTSGMVLPIDDQKDTNQEQGSRESIKAEEAAYLILKDYYTYLLAIGYNGKIQLSNQPNIRDFDFQPKKLPKNVYHGADYTVAVNLSSGMSAGLLFFGGAVAGHVGFAYDSKGNRLEYSATESYVDFLASTEEFLKGYNRPDFKAPDTDISLGGNFESGELTAIGDIDIIDLEGAYLENSTVFTYMNTVDLTYDFFIFSVTFAHESGYRPTPGNYMSVYLPNEDKLKGVKASASVGKGYAFGWSQTDPLYYVAYHVSDNKAFGKATDKLKKNHRNIPDYSATDGLYVTREFRLIDKEKKLYRLWYMGSTLFNGDWTTEIDTEVNFTYDGKGYKSINVVED